MLPSNFEQAKYRLVVMLSMDNLQKLRSRPSRMVVYLFKAPQFTRVEIKEKLCFQKHFCHLCLTWHLDRKKTRGKQASRKTATMGHYSSYINLQIPSSDPITFFARVTQFLQISTHYLNLFLLQQDISSKSYIYL